MAAKSVTTATPLAVDQQHVQRGVRLPERPRYTTGRARGHTELIDLNRPGTVAPSLIAKDKRGRFVQPRCLQPRAGFVLLVSWNAVPRWCGRRAAVELWVWL